jgi:hypothetical protein
LSADLRVQFSQAVDASNRAVMADTDESSLGFVREAEQATREATRAAASLVGLLQSLRFSNESQILREFDARFSEYQKLDRRILQLAVENTNLKAQALSYGPARQVASRFRDALDATAASFPSSQRCRVDGPLAQALLAVREIQTLHAPHIAERDDGQMTRLEREMAELQLKAKSRLQSLREGAPPNAHAALDAALAALDEFKTTSERIVALSRRNTNLVSLDLALRERPPLATACDDRLRLLQQLLANRNSKATR